MLSAYPVSLKFLRQGVQTQHQFLPKVPVKWYGPKTELKISKKNQNDVQRQTFKDLQKGWRNIIKEHFRKVSASLEEDILIIFTYFSFFSAHDVVWN